MAIWLLAALIEARRLTPSLEMCVRPAYRDRNEHRELRIMAANVVGAHGNQSDADGIERTVRTDLDRRSILLAEHQIPILVVGFPLGPIG